MASSSIYQVSSVEVSSPNNTVAKSSTPGCGGDMVSAENAQFEQRVVELINGERDQAGLPPLKMVAGLTNASRYHAADLAEQEYFNHDSHDRINGHLVRVCDWKMRTQAYYPTAHAEMLAEGPATPQTVVRAWMAESAEREQILGEHREIGVGYSQQRWVQILGTRAELYPLVIDGEAIRTEDLNVSLYIYGEWDEVRLRNNGGEWSDWRPFTNRMAWALEPSEGQQMVEAEMRTDTATASSSDMIHVVLSE